MSSLLKKILTILPIFMILGGCSGLEESEKEKMRRTNAVAEQIYRNHDEFPYQIEPPKHRIRAPYPWEQKKETAKKK